MRVCASILPDVYPKFSLLKTAAKIQKIFDIRKFSGNFLQKSDIQFFQYFSNFRLKNEKLFAYVEKKQYLCTRFWKTERYTVVIAQLAEHRIVVPSVVGSSPTLHP